MSRVKEQDMLNGVKAGLEMLEVVDKKIKPYVRDFYGGDFRIGIGLHHGLVVAGSIGGRDNKRHTIIGDAVNFTSRIESSNKRLGTEFLISEDVYAVVQQEGQGQSRTQINYRTGEIRPPYPL